MSSENGIDSDEKLCGLETTDRSQSSDLCSGSTTKIVKDEGDKVGSWQSVYSPTTVTMNYQAKRGPGRYKQSLKHLLPVRIPTGPGASMPVDQTGCFSFMLFSWLTPLVWRAYRKGLTAANIYYCSPFESAKLNGARLSVIWDKESHLKSREIPFRHVLFRFIGTRYIVACFAYSFCLGCGFVGPTLFLRMLLEYTESPRDDVVEGVLWTTGLFFCELLRIFSIFLLWAINCRTAVRAHAGVSSILYRKITKLRVTSGKTTGELINHFSNDCNKIMLMVYTSPLIIGGPLVMVAAVIYMWWLIGMYCLVSVAVFTFAYVFQFAVSKLNVRFQRKVVKATESRVSLMREILSYMRLVKLYAWERCFQDRISDIRNKERSYLEKCQFIQTISVATASLMAVLATVVTIISFTFSKHNLHSSEAFTLLMVNIITAHGLRTLPLCIRDIINGLVSLQRLETFLQLEEKVSYSTTPQRPDQAIYLSKATLSWPVVSAQDETLIANTKNEEDCEDQSNLVIPLTAQPALLDISFSLSTGQIYGVCGSVGSGKSSLLAALLGQMHLVNGQVTLKPSCAYVAQQSWILNASVKENILFGQAFNSKRYYEAVYCCSLTEDLAAFSHGDQTEVGENGITLSGGQKQRLSLARALYSNKDLYLLDDPLSAVDANVGKHIFQHCIKGAMRGKSILMVTNQIQYLSECDKVVLMRDGQIVEEGHHDALLEGDSEYAEFISNIKNNIDTSFNVSKDSLDYFTPDSETSRSRSSSKVKSVTSLVSSVSGSIDDVLHDSPEQLNLEIATGEISLDTYKAYITSAGGVVVCGLVVLWFALHSGLLSFSNWWLSYWIHQGSGTDVIDIETGHKLHTNIIENPHLKLYEMVYGLLVVGMLVTTLVLGFLYMKTTFRASSKLHDRLLYRVLHCPMKFFETVPTGRILNIFTRDLDEVDVQLPIVMDPFLQHFMIIVFSLLIVAYVFVWFFIAIVFMAVFLFFLHRVFRASIRDLKRIENANRAPLYTHISTTVQGLATIQAFQRQEDFIERFSNLVDRHSSPLYLYYSSLRWLAARLDLLCLVIMLLICLMTVFLKHQVGAAFAGLAIVLSMQLSGTMQYLVRIGCDVESKFTSVERIYTYTENLEREAPSINEKNRAAPDWPTRGRISFREVNMRYRQGLPMVLKNITFDISPQEKIGIVGRTGAGKSSIGVALFRLVELVSGSIHIDGVDISGLGLEDLRSRMSIIPQDPILFHGTIRQNLDPLGVFNDNELWEVLEETSLKDKVSSLHGGLNAIVNDKADNFSVGEVQLLCLARSLLRHSKIVVLDEATASIDGETEKVIQKTIEKVFVGCTVLVIAHRISSVMNCDRVMVFDEGRLVEIDSPSKLLADPRSHFAQMTEITRL